MSSRNSRWEHERHDWFNCHIWSVIFDQAFGDINVISDRQGREYKFASALNLKTVIKETLKVIQANEQTIESFKTARR
ncbi:unnamed protein product [Rhizophagus irregularis]|nr:unnamed protein product [Rhizophagus irregularis]CAB5357196.1 unnamed protein product [Rhizophagus irregularis]